MAPLITLGRTFELLDIDVGHVVAKVDHVFMRGMFCYRVERRKALAGSLLNMIGKPFGIVRDQFRAVVC